MDTHYVTGTFSIMISSKALLKRERQCRDTVQNIRNKEHDVTIHLRKKNCTFLLMDYDLQLGKLLSIKLFCCF